MALETGRIMPPDSHDFWLTVQGQLRGLMASA